MSNYFNIKSYGLSDIGLIRRNNEDVIASLPSHNFYVIADGMGGHKAGEIAAKEATNELISSIIDLLKPHSKKQSFIEIKKQINKAITKANNHVYFLGKENQKYEGMGTTICCIYFYKRHAVFAHVGDSRIYLLRENKLYQLTKDHSLISKLKDKGLLKKKTSIVNNYKNIITKAVGIYEKISPSIDHLKFKEKDLFCMCTDGLSDYLSKDEIKKILISPLSNDEKVKLLIESAKKNGSRDNISSLIIDIAK